MRFPALLLALLACSCMESENQQPTHLSGSTVVSLVFDDTLADQVQAGEMLAARGLVGTFYVNSPRLVSPGYITLSEALSLQEQGDEIGGHTLDHPHLTELTKDQMTFEICEDRNALLTDGFAVTSFAYPFAADNDTVHSVVEHCNYNSARDGGGLRSSPTCTECPYGNTMPPKNPYQLRTNGSFQSTNTLADLEKWVTGAEQHGGGWVPITFHHVCDGCETNAISPAMLRDFLDWLAPRASRGTHVMTVNQVIGGDVKPPVPVSQ